MIIIYSIFAFGSALAAIAGILIAFDTDMTPTMGFHIFLYAVVVVIIGGMGSYKGLIGGALRLATAQHLSAYDIEIGTSGFRIFPFSPFLSAEDLGKEIKIINPKTTWTFCLV